MKHYLLLLALIVSNVAIAQNQVPLYMMDEVTPQSVNLNPAFIPDYKFAFGLPALSGSYISINTDQASIDDLVNIDNGRITIDTTSSFTTSGGNNRFEVDGDVPLIYVGFKSGFNYISIIANTRADGNFNLNGDLLSLVIYGNDHPNTRGKVIDLSEINMRGQVYHELGVTFARQINSRLQVGAGIKVLRGVNSIDFVGPSSRIAASIDSIYIQAEEFQVNTSGVETSRQGFEYFGGGNNFGMSINFGASYQLNSAMRLSTSVNDLGFINWNEDVVQYRFNEIDYSFKGFRVFDFIGSELNEEIISDEADSLRNLIEPEKIEGGSFRTNLTARTYLGYTYDLHPKHQLGVIAVGDFYRGIVIPAFSLNYRFSVNPFTLVVNTGYRNKSLGNFGMGMAVNLGPIQLYGMTENLLAFTNFTGSRRVDFRFGLNVVVREKALADSRL